MTTPAHATAIQTHDNPFPGLRPFDATENHLFFGRDGQSDEILSSLRRNRFVAVVGTSGSGKSSLIRAGLMPLLHGGFMAKASSSWRIAIFRPGSDPIGNLALTLNRPDVLGTDTADAKTSTLITETTLRRSGLGLIEAVRQARMPPVTNLLIVVDQFEELFRFRGGANAEASEDDATFVKLLIEATRQSEAPIYVVITMRSDFIGDCARFRELPETINRGLYLIPLMTRDQRREAITGPAAVAGTEISPPLINRLLNDLGDNPAQLPILQHALMRTWGDWDSHHKDEGAIDLRHYEKIGTMTNALSLHADEAFDELPGKRSQEIAEKLFKALAEKGPDNREVRRPTKVAEIAAIADASEAEVITVIEAFRQAGRSFLMPPPEVPLSSQSLIDVSHESLISGWRRLKGWVEAEAISAGIYRRVAETAGLYEKGEAGLWHDPDLQVALGWQSKVDPNAAWGRRYHPGFPAAMNFLAESVAARDRDLLLKEKQRVRALRRTRIFAAVLGVLLVMASALGVWAMTQTRKARQQEVRAKQQEVRANQEAAEANRQRYKAEEQRGIAYRKTLEADKANEALTETNGALQESKGKLVTALAKATKAEQSANHSAKIAEDASTEAEKRRLEAAEDRDMALRDAWNNNIGFDELSEPTKKLPDVLRFYDQLLQRAIKASDKVLGRDPDNKQAMVVGVTSQGTLPSLHRIQGKSSQAKKDSDVFEKRAEEMARDKNYFRRMLGAFLLSSMADARMHLEEEDAAVRDARRAAEVADEVTLDAGPKDDLSWLFLRITYRSAGEVQENYKHLDDALRNYQKVVAARAQAGNVTVESDSTLHSDLEVVARLQRQVGRKDDALKTYAEARKYYRAQIDSSERTAHAYPSDTNTRQVVDAYQTLASFEHNAENDAGAREATDHRIRLLTPLVSRPGAEPEYKNLLAGAFGSRSWYDLFVGDFGGAIADAKRGLEYDDKEVWIHTNEAHGYLFLGQIEQARKIYFEYADKRAFPGTADFTIFRESVLNDFKDFRKRGIPNVDLHVIDNIESELKAKPLSR